ncbi:uncharacterized protein METZ01_LOCUS117192 [marine metagenome]|uniref:Uncharacterized protein n=1 Tax=marine metagenome TaxID=408172 RepID=A0A381XHY1_9ZZZZ
MEGFLLIVDDNQIDPIGKHQSDSKLDQCGRLGF